MVRGQGNLMWEERLTKQDLFRLEKSTEKSYRYPSPSQWERIEVTARKLREMHRDRMRGNKQKLEHRKF